jgi:hypothetical protein
MLTRTKAAGGLAGLLAIGAGLLPATGPTLAASPAAAPLAAVAEPPVFTATLARSYDTFDANQGVAVDDKYFYVVDNRSITKHDKATGQPLLQFAANGDGPVIHMDSGAVVNGKLYAAHSNYSDYPMESSIEVFDTRTMRHLTTYSFGIFRGSLTWLDRHDGAWWAGFANYDVIPSGQTKPYGETYNQHTGRQAQRRVPGGRGLDHPEGDPRPVQADEQLRRLLGSGRPALVDRTRPR